MCIRDRTYHLPRSTILQIFSFIAQTVYEICVTNFFPIFGLGGTNPLAKVHQKWRWPGGLRGLPSCEISSPYVNPRPRYPLPCYQSPVDKEKKQTNSNRFYPQHAYRHVWIKSSPIRTACMASFSCWPVQLIDRSADSNSLTWRNGRWPNARGVPYRWSTRAYAVALRITFCINRPIYVVYKAVYTQSITHVRT